MKTSVGRPNQVGGHRCCCLLRSGLGGLVVMLFLATCMAVNGKSISQAADQPTVWFPFKTGTKWIIVQGYNTDHTHRHGEYDKYALDLQVKRRTQEEQNQATEGQPLYAPVDGEFAWYEESTGTVAIRTGEAGAGPRGQKLYWYVQVIHMKDVPGFESSKSQMVQGETFIGNASNVGTRIPHVHIAVYKGEYVDSGTNYREEAHFQSLEGMEWPEKDNRNRTEEAWEDETVWRGMTELPGNVPVGVTVIDESDEAFSKQPEEHWYPVSGIFGYKNLFLYTFCVSETENVGNWSLGIRETGEYEVFAYIPLIDKMTTNAEYSVHHKNGMQTVPVDQAQCRGEWVSLGTFTFAGEDGERVELGDVTGENSNSTKVTYDAVGYVFRRASRVPWWERLVGVIIEWLEKLKKKLEEQWEERKQKLEEQWEEWKQEQIERLKRTVEEEFLRWLERQCTGASVPFILVILAGTVSLYRRRKNGDNS
jgi:hypothetical protein